MAAVQNVIQYNGGADMDVQRLSMPMHWNEDRPITQRQYALANPVIFVANDQTRLSRILNREIRGCRVGDLQGIDTVAIGTEFVDGIFGPRLVVPLHIGVPVASNLLDRGVGRRGCRATQDHLADPGSVRHTEQRSHVNRIRDALQYQHQIISDRIGSPPLPPESLERRSP